LRLTYTLFVWLVADGWCWFVLREKYCWLVAGGWFVLREKYYWLVANKANEQGLLMSHQTHKSLRFAHCYCRPAAPHIISMVTARGERRGKQVSDCSNYFVLGRQDSHEGTSNGNTL
jgi:hypothetical protein